MSDDAPTPRPRRRRWLRVVGLLFLVALVSGFIFWLVKPESATATALFEVRMDSPSVLGNQLAQLGGESNYEIFKNTQVALLKSKFLLASALRDPKIGGSPLFAGVADPEAWLQDHLEVGYPQNGEILEIKLRGSKSQANDLIVMVDAIAEAYNREAIGKEKSLQLTRRDMLELSLRNLNTDIKRKYEDYLDIAKGMGKSQGSKDIQQQLDIKRMDRIDEELAQLEREQLKIETSGDVKESKFAVARIAQLRKRQEELNKDIQNRNEKSVELETRGEELKQLQQIANEMNIRLEKLDIDSQSPARIRQVQPATIERGDIAAGFMRYLGNP
jgi:hypothetical protein